VLWQPTEKSLRNVELDEAGKLAAFRERYGRGFDLRSKVEDEEAAAAAGDKKKGGKKDLKHEVFEEVEEDYEDVDDLGDLISGYGANLTPDVEKKPAPRPKKK
jgi:hypothetical protein